MSKNGVAKILSRIGILIIVIGAFLFVFWGVMTRNIVFGIGAAIGIGITGIMLIGFAEIIDLLQECLKRQNEINKDIIDQTKVILKLNESAEVIKETLKQGSTK